MLRRISIWRRFEPPERPVGYFPNWKKFVPRKLRPVSIEPRRAVTVVMTPMTEKTPMVMPSIVRIERSLFTPIEAKAMRRISTSGMGKTGFRFQILDLSFPSICSVVPVENRKSKIANSKLFIAQSDHGIEPRGTPRRGETGQDPGDDRNQHADHHQVGRELDRETGHLVVDSEEDRIGHPHADNSSDEADGHRLDQELQENRATPGTDGLARADLLGAFLHAHERDVHDPDGTDKERKPGDEQTGERNGGLYRIQLGLERLLLVDGKII